MNEEDFEKWLSYTVMLDASQFQKPVVRLWSVASSEGLKQDPAWCHAAGHLNKAAKAIDKRRGN